MRPETIRVRDTKAARMSDLTLINQIVEAEASALGFDVVRVQMMQSEAGDGGQALQIMAEDPATGQLVIEQCAQLSRRISERIDDYEDRGDVLVEGNYHLEVSSPGIDRPLTREKDFTDWAGHEARIVMQKGWSEDATAQRVYKGVLGGLDAEMVALDDPKAGAVQLPRALIHAAKLTLTDALIKATQPLDTSGVDDIEEEPAEKADD